jgi:Regulator of chromosome condensation (RCC1) repeat
VPTSGLGKEGGANEAIPARVTLWLIFVLAGGVPAFPWVWEQQIRRAFDQGLPWDQAMTFGGLTVARMRRGRETVVSFTTGAGRGRRGAVLAVVAAMVGLVVAALPAAPAAAATSQSLVPWGDHLRQAFAPTGLSNVTGIAAGGDHGLRLHGDGTVGAWGSWDYGQNAVPAELDHVVAISAGWDHSLALKDDGTVVAWGDTTGQSNGVMPFLRSPRSDA